MKVPSLDRLYIKLDKCIRLVEAHTEIKNLSFIIKACRLKPHNYVFGKRNNATILYDRWFDEYGNFFTINNKKKIKIIYNDLRLNKQDLICTDLYYGLSLPQIAKISKVAHLIAGRDEDLYQECYLLSFLGIDDYLRSYLYYYGEWQQVSPLMMGIKNLKIVAKHRGIRKFKQIIKKENLIVGCVGSTSWISSVPVSDGFLEMFKNKHELLVSIFKD